MKALTISEINENRSRSVSGFPISQNYSRQTSITTQAIASQNRLKQIAQENKLLKKKRERDIKKRNDEEKEIKRHNLEQYKLSKNRNYKKTICEF